MTVGPTQMHGALPKVVLLDLDDTILDDSGNVASCWEQACLAHRTMVHHIDETLLHETIDRVRNEFWADPERHRQGRQDLGTARRRIVATALACLGIENAALTDNIAEAYSAAREAQTQPFAKAIDTLQWLRSSGCRLALLTNGAATVQRRKIERFRLAEFFDHILVEGELGFGKPDPRIYRLALVKLAVRASDAWMVGDNLEWDVAQPQQLGIYSIWVDVAGQGLPPGHSARPNRIVRRLSDLLDGVTQPRADTALNSPL